MREGESNILVLRKFMASKTLKARVSTNKWKQGKSKTKVPRRSRDTIGLHLVVLVLTQDLSLDHVIEEHTDKQIGILRNPLSLKEGVLRGRSTQ